MYPAQAVRIKEEFPDSDPSDDGDQPTVPPKTSQSCAANLLQEREIKSERVDIEVDVSPMIPEIPVIYIKQEPPVPADEAFSDTAFATNIKQENCERDRSPSNFIVNIKQEPLTEVPHIDYQYTQTEKPLPPITAKVQCQICKLFYPSLAELEVHIEAHNNDNPYKCNKCNRNYKSRQTLRVHESRGGCSPRPDIVCRECGLEFSRMFLYKSHVKIHTDIRPYKCEYCPMAFRHRQTIVKHLTKHTNDRPIVCPVCKEVFSTQASIKLHLKKYTSQKPFPCPICQKTFSLKHNAEKHLLIHCTEKVLNCSVCHKTFPRESRLRYHMNSHMKTKSFYCNECGRAFSHKSNVVRHMHRKHPALVKEGLYMPFK